MNSITRMRMIAAKNSSAMPFSRVTRRDYGRAKSSFGAPPTKEEEELPISASPWAKTIFKWYMGFSCVLSGVAIGNYYFPATGPMWKEMTALSDEVQLLQEETKKLRSTVASYEAKEPLRVYVSSTPRAFTPPTEGLQTAE